AHAPVVVSNGPKKPALCAVYSAWELVFVPTADPGDDPDAGQYNFILYGAWSRPDVNGEIDVLFPLLGSNPSSNDDDRVISYDFNDSTNVTTVDVLAWNGSAWVSTNIAASTFNVTTTSGEVLHAVTGASLTFG